MQTEQHATAMSSAAGDPSGELFQRMIRHIGEYFERDLSHLTLESRFDSAVPGLDSLKLFEMMLYLEDCFGVHFEEAALMEVQTLRDLLRVLEAQGAAKPVSPVTPCP